MKKTIIILAVLIIIIGGVYLIYQNTSDDAFNSTSDIKINNVNDNNDNTDIDNPWLCDGKEWIKNGEHNMPKPTSVCDKDHASPQFIKNDTMLDWSTMNEGPYNDSVTYATSSDLLNWETSKEILATHASVPGAVIKDGVIYVYFVDVSTDGLVEQLGMVKSTNQAQTWSDQTTLTIEGIGDKAPADPAPVLLGDGRIRLFFFDINDGRINAGADGIEPSAKIYSAISDDGVNFVMEDGIRFERQAGVYDPDIELFDGIWYMYGGVHAGNQVIYATSSDGLNFTEQGVAYNGSSVPDVFYENGLYYLYTAGIDIATGTTPTSFTSTGRQFRDNNSAGATADPSVVKLDDGTYLMLYKIQ